VVLRAEDIENPNWAPILRAASLKMEGNSEIEFIFSASMVCAACERLVKNKNAPSAPDPCA